MQLALRQPFDQSVDLVHLLVSPARRQKRVCEAAQAEAYQTNLLHRA
jgi:hypothetical protein